MSAPKHAPVKWDLTWDNDNELSELHARSADGERNLVARVYMVPEAVLLHEALCVATNTGRTPRHLAEERADLLAALKACRDAEAMPTTGDHSGFVWPERPLRWPGNPSGGWECPKHGLGYWQPCGCCADDYARHCALRDEQARNRRDDALRAAQKAADAAIAKAEGRS